MKSQSAADKFEAFREVDTVLWRSLAAVDDLSRSHPEESISSARRFAESFVRSIAHHRSISLPQTADAFRSGIDHLSARSMIPDTIRNMLHQLRTIANPIVHGEREATVALSLRCLAIVYAIAEWFDSNVVLGRAEAGQSTTRYFGTSSGVLESPRPIQILFLVSRREGYFVSLQDDPARAQLIRTLVNPGEDHVSAIFRISQPLGLTLKWATVGRIEKVSFGNKTCDLVSYVVACEGYSVRQLDGANVKWVNTRDLASLLSELDQLDAVHDCLAKLADNAVVMRNLRETP